MHWLVITVQSLKFDTLLLKQPVEMKKDFIIQKIQL